MAVIFPVAVRNPSPPPHHDFAAPFAVPAAAAGKKLFVHPSGLTQADLDDPAVSFQLRAYVQDFARWPGTGLPDPNAINLDLHDEMYGVVFTGGPNQGRGGAVTPVPGFNADGDKLVGKSVGFWLYVLGRAVSAGLDADVV